MWRLGSSKTFSIVLNERDAISDCCRLILESLFWSIWINFLMKHFNQIEKDKLINKKSKV